MQAELAQPWFDSALERLLVRLGNRLLGIDPSSSEAVALRAAVGDQGELTLVVGNRQIAEQIAEQQWPRVKVLAHTTIGDESYGTFDSLLIAPRTGPVLPADDYAALARNNLRPGGRFVVDVPGDDMLPDVRAAWHQLGWDEERLAPLRGLNDVELTEAMRSAGLRAVQAALGSHLLHLPSPTELAVAYGDVLELDDDQITELGHEMVRQRQDAGPIDALAHRTQVGGQR